MKVLHTHSQVLLVTTTTVELSTTNQIYTVLEYSDMNGVSVDYITRDKDGYTIEDPALVEEIYNYLESYINTEES